MEWLNNQYIILSLIAAIFVFLPSYIKSIKFAYYINNVYETTLRQFLTNEDLIDYFLQNLKPRIVNSFIIFFCGVPKDMTNLVKNREVLDDSFRLILDIIKILEEEHNESKIETYHS